MSEEGAPAGVELLRARFTRPYVVAAGVTLVGLPTVFTVIPSFADWHVGVRGALLAVWACIAATTVAASGERDRNVQTLAEDRSALAADRIALRRNLRAVAYLDVIQALLRSGTKGTPTHYKFTIYLYDPESDTLVPNWPNVDFRGEPDPRVFAPGRGATGTAWRDRKVVVVTGSEVADDTYELSDAQREYFKDWRVAAAVPILEDASEPIGVLTALGKEDDRFFDVDTPGQSVLRHLADDLGVVLRSIPDTEEDS